MIYIFLLSFGVFSIIDYIYIYTYLDSKLFYSQNGSKLGRYIKDNKAKYSIFNQVRSNSKRVQNIISGKVPKKTYLKILILILIFILAQVSSILIFKDILFSNFVILNLGYKKLELVSNFDSYFQNFKYLYYSTYTIFLVIILNKLRSCILIDKFFKDQNIDHSLFCEMDEIVIGEDDNGVAIKINVLGLYQNLLITGSIGSGKTSSIISNVTDELIGKGYSGLILDIKGNYVDIVQKICQKHGKEGKLFILSDRNELKYNPLGSNVEPIEMASRLRQVIEIISPVNNSDSYWLSKVENVLFNVIMLIRYYNYKKVDFMEIHKIITDAEYLEKKILDSKSRILKTDVDDKLAFEMSNVFGFFEKEFANMENRVRNIILSEVTRVTIPFVTSYREYKRFGSFDEENYATKLKEDVIFVLSMNIAKNKVLSKMLATFIKLEFQKQIISNIGSPKTKFLIADEYQEFANEEDAHFLSLSREAKCINILSMQSYTSLKKSLKNEPASQVIIQNMVNKIWFRNDDNYTAAEIVKQLGKEYITKESVSVSEGAQETRKNLLIKGFKNKKSNISETINYIQSKENIYDENYFTRELKTFEAIVFLSDGNSIQPIRKVVFERWDIKNDKASNGKFQINN